MEDAEISRYNSSVSDEFTEILSSLIFFTLELSKVDDKTIKDWMNDTNSNKWEPYLTSFKKKKSISLRSFGRRNTN